MSLFWNYLGVGVIGFLVGQIVTFGYMRARGRRIVLPFIENTSRNFTIGVIVMGLICTSGVWSSMQKSEDTARCNREFRDAIKYNSDVTSEQRDMNDRAAAISRERRTVMDQMFIQIGGSIGDPAKVQDVIADYNTRVARLSRDYDKLIADRNALNRTRTGYPAPSCGGMR